MIVRDGDISIRAMRDVAHDYACVIRWRNTPHVREWWDPDDSPMTIEDAERELRPFLSGAGPDRICFIEWRGRPVGFVQYYPWAAYQDDLDQVGITVPDGSWSLDIYIGEPDAISRGIGSRVVRMVCDHLIATEGASAVALGVDRDNARARKAYQKAGMIATTEYLDTDTRNGIRTWSVLMVRMANQPAAPVPGH